MPLGPIGKIAVAKHVHDRRKDDDSSSSSDEEGRRRGLGPVGKVAAVGAIHHHREHDSSGDEMGPAGKVGAALLVKHRRDKKIKKEVKEQMEQQHKQQEHHQQVSWSKLVHRIRWFLSWALFNFVLLSVIVGCIVLVLCTSRSNDGSRRVISSSAQSAVSFLRTEAAGTKQGNNIK